MEKHLAVSSLQDNFAAATEKWRIGERKLASNALRRLFKVVLGVGVLGIAISAQGANWYVRPLSAGTANGSNWNNAWSMANLNSNWSSVAAGDTVWLAGGTYTTQIAPTKSGTSANLIYIKRPRTTDSIPTGAPGWLAAFDSQVIIAPVVQIPLIWTGANGEGSYLYFDGRVDSGIRLFKDNSIIGAGSAYVGAATFARGSAHQTNITLANIELAGAADNLPASNFNFGAGSGQEGYVCCLSLDNDFNTDPAYSNILLTHCRLHGSNETVLATHATGLIFEYCKIYNNGSGNSFHANLMELHGCGTFTMRYCDVSDWQVEGIFPFDTLGAVEFYGNVWHDPNNPVARVFEPSLQMSGAIGPIHAYNNTFVGGTIQILAVWNTLLGTWQTGSIGENNIYWRCNGNSSDPNMQTNDYNFADISGVPGTHSISTGTNPFVNYAAKDYHITSSISATLPRNKGVALGAAYNADLDGNIRGTDGAWDIGAYEYSSGGTPSPTPTATATATGTPSATPTATATPVSSPSPTAGPLGLSFDASAGVITAPFSITNNAVSQNIETPDPTQGGRAFYSFLVPTTGDYFLSAMVNCPDEGTNSFFLNIDAEPTVAMTWHVPVTSGFELRLATWWEIWPPPPDLAPKTWTLNAGTHQLIIRGREANAILQHITVGAAPRPPQGLHVIP